MIQYFASHPLTPTFVLEVMLGYLLSSLSTTIYIFLLVNVLKVEPSDLGFLTLPTFDRMLPMVISTVLIAPLEEEIVFRGLTSLLFGVTGIVIGTIVWAAAHLPSRVQIFSSYPSSVQKKAVAILLMLYLTHGIYYAWLWAVGAGLVAVFMHFMNNAVAVLATYRSLNKKQTDLFEEKKEEVEPVEDIWVDKNPPQEPVFLRPITDPSYFTVIAEGDEVKVIKKDAKTNTKANTKTTTKTKPKTRAKTKTKQSIPPVTPAVSGEIRESRLNLRYIDRYVKEKYREEW